MSKTSTKITIREAVEAGWASKPTMYRAVKQGRISVDKTIPGRQLLDVSELVRVFGEPVSRADKAIKADTNPVASRMAELEHETALLRERLKSVEKERDSLVETKNEALEREKRLMGIVEAQTRQLTSSVRKTGLWGRLFKSPGKVD